MTPEERLAAAGKEKAKPFPWTDYGLAERLVAQHGKEIRYCPARRCWYIWNGKVWARDDRLMIETLAKAAVRAMDSETATYKDEEARAKFRSFVTRSEAAARISSMVSLARSEQEIVVTPDQLDANPWLFNCRNGTLDLQSGELRPHRMEDLITLMAPVDYDSEAWDQRWEDFLDAVLGDEPDGSFERFLQRAAFASMVGVQRDKVLLVLLGPGNTGKTTFLNALHGTFGPYADTMSSDSLLQRSFTGGARSDLATLEGKRFVAASEIEQGKKLNEGLVKALTGGEAGIKAKLLYENEREYRPQFTLWIGANDMALIRQEDDGSWNRFTPIPFLHIFKDGKDEKKDVKDTFLRDPAIHAAVLTWAMAGRTSWLNNGIGSHPKVDALREAQKDEMNPLSDFFEDKVEFGEEYFATSTGLRTAYEDWCIVNSVRPINLRDFKKLLKDKGCVESSRRHNGKKVKGLNGVKLA